MKMEFDELDQFAIEEAIAANPDIDGCEITNVYTCGDDTYVWYKVPEEWGWGEITHDYVIVHF